MHLISRLTSTARNLDPRLPNHRVWMLAAVAGAALTVALGQGEGATGRAFRGGLAVFLAWAIARELDPDETRTANLAALLAIGAVGLLGAGNALPGVLILLTARLVVRSTGNPPTFVDHFVILPAWSFFAAGTVSGWLAGLILAFAVARDHRLPSPAPPRSLISAFLISAIASGGVLLKDAFAPGWETPGAPEVALALIGLVAGASLRGYIPAAKADLTGEALDPFRLQSARRHILVGAGLATLVGGSAGTVEMAPVWVALTACALIGHRLVPAFGPG